jgi:general nucleoside transport system permease protein
VKILKRFLNSLLVPLLAIVTAIVIGGIIIAAVGGNPFAAYWGLVQGAFGSTKALSETGVWATPYIFAGLAVALAFKGGLFNIGAEGQLALGAVVSSLIGYALPGWLHTSLPIYIHLPLAIILGLLGGAIWAAIPGALKAYTGGHEVINTIMMNYIAYRLMDYLLNGPLKSGGTPATPNVLPTAILATIFPSPVRLHWGIFIALGLAVVVYWLLWKTPFGMELRMVGVNEKAARYAGVSVKKTMVLAMVISAVLCGLAGSIHLLGVDHRMMPSFSPGYGFDAIALALLGNSHPLGVVLSSLLFAFLRGGAPRMQVVAGTPVEIIRIIQGMVIVFVAAPEIIRGLYHLRSSRREKKSAAPIAGKS